jgi:hypothetical protein
LWAVTNAATAATNVAAAATNVAAAATNVAAAAATRGAAATTNADAAATNADAAATNVGARGGVVGVDAVGCHGPSGTWSQLGRLLLSRHLVAKGGGGALGLLWDGMAPLALGNKSAGCSKGEGGRCGCYGLSWPLWHMVTNGPAAPL